MINKFGEINIRYILILFVILFIAVLLGRNVANVSSPKPLFLTLGLVVFVITIINSYVGLFIIIFSMLLSPEILVGVVPGKDVVIRLEDLLLIVVTFSWMAKAAVSKQFNLFKKNPLNLPIGIYILVCVILTLRGMLLGHVIPLKGIFYLLKYIEYFILYFMVLSQIRTKRQIRTFTIALLLTCGITSLYADLHIGSMSRVSAPFEGPSGEPNTLGGYLVFMFAIVMGIFLYSTSKKVKLYLLGLVFLIIPAFLFTLSRTAYIALIPVWISLIVFGPRKLVLTGILLLSIIVGTIFLPGVVKERIGGTFKVKEVETIETMPIGEMMLDASATARIISWQDILEQAKDRPVLGYGITGIGFVDGQYIRVLGELGLVGLFAFLFLLLSIFKHSKHVFLKVTDRFYKGLSLGFLVGFIGMIFFNAGANGFIITRIMEPLWFVAAMIILLPQLEEEPEIEPPQMI